MKLKVLLLGLTLSLLPFCSLAGEPEDKALEAFLIQTGVRDKERKIQEYAYKFVVRKVGQKTVDIFGFCYHTANTKSLSFSRENYTVFLSLEVVTLTRHFSF